jgi:hypothetical protein
MSDGKFTAHPNPALMGTDTRTWRSKDDLHSDKEATTHRQAHPKEALPRGSTTSQSPERVSPFQRNPLVHASVTKVVALATTNSRPGRATGSPGLVLTRHPTWLLGQWSRGGKTTVEVESCRTLTVRCVTQVSIASLLMIDLRLLGLSMNAFLREQLGFLAALQALHIMAVAMIGSSVIFSCPTILSR